MDRKEPILYGTALLYTIVALLPLLAMLAKSLYIEDRFTIDAYRLLFSSERQWTLLENSLKLAFAVSISASAAGALLGLLFSRFDLPARGFFALLFTVPLLVPPYIWAVGWADLLSPGGVLSEWVDPVLLKGLYERLFGFEGAVFILFCVYLPIPMLLTMLLLKSVNPHLEEAARVVTWWSGVLRSITLPLVAPGILFGAVLVFLLTFGELSVPGFLRFDVYALESFTSFSAFYDFASATAYAVVMFVVAIVLLLLEAPFMHKTTSRLGFVYVLKPRESISLGRYKAAAVLSLFAGVAVMVFAPLGALLVQSGGWDTYLEAFLKAGDSLGRTVWYAAVTATILTLFGFLTGYMMHRRSTACWKFLDISTLFLFTLPSAVVGIGLISLWNTPWTTFVYSTPLIVVMGFAAKYLLLPSRITVAQLALIPDSMEEAAQMVGAGWVSRMVYIVVPLAMRSLAAAWLAVYIFVVRDTSLAMLLYPPDGDTLSVRIFTLMANGAPDLIAALCVVMIVMSLLPVAFIVLFGRRSGG